MGDEQGRGKAGTKRLVTILGLALALVLAILQMGSEDSSRASVEPSDQQEPATAQASPDPKALLAPGREGQSPTSEVASASTQEEESAERESLEPESDERSLIVRVRDARGELVNGVAVTLYKHGKSGWAPGASGDIRISGMGGLVKKVHFVADWKANLKGVASWDGLAARLRPYKLGRYWQESGTGEESKGSRIAVGVSMPGLTYAELPVAQRLELDLENWSYNGIDLRLDDEALSTLIPIQIKVYFADGRPAPGIPVGLRGVPLHREMGNGSFFHSSVSDSRGVAQIALSGMTGILSLLSEIGGNVEELGGPMDLFEFSVAATIPSLTLTEVALPKGLSPGQVVRLDLPPVVRVRATFWDHRSKGYGGEGQRVHFRVDWREGTGLVTARSLSVETGSVPASFYDLGWVGMGVACKGAAWPEDNTAPQGSVDLPALQSPGELELRFEFGEPHLRIAWLVLDENGEALIDARLRFFERDRDMDPNPRSKVRRHWRNATTDGQGRFLRSLHSSMQRPRVIELRYGSGEGTTWAVNPIPMQSPSSPQPKALGVASIVNVGQFRLSRTPLADLPQPIEVAEIAGAEGYVLDSEGTPIRGVYVYARAIAKGRSGTLGMTRTSSNGHFDLSLNFVEPFRLTFSHEGYLTWDPWPVKSYEPGTGGLQIVLERGRRAQLSFQHFNLPFGNYLEVRASSDDGNFEAKKSGSGTFEFKSLPGGQVDITLHAKKSRIELARIEGIEPSFDLEQVDPRLVDIDFRTIAYARWYTFELPSGEPLKGEDVRMQVPGYPKARSRQDTNGTSRLFLVLPRDVPFVTFHVEGIGSAVVPMGDDDVTVRLAAGG